MTAEPLAAARVASASCRPRRSAVASASSARALVRSGWRARQCTRWPPSAYSAAICEPISPAPTTTTSISGDHRAMRIVITGGLGMFGTELARRLRATRPGDELLLLDMPAALAPPDDLADALVLRGDIRDGAILAEALDGPEVAVVHLASVVSGGAERDFDAALDVNLDGGPRARRGLPRTRHRPAARVHELARRVRRRGRARPGRRRHAHDARDHLRRDQGHARAAVRRRDPQGLPRRALGPAADRDRAPRRPQRGRLRFRQRRRARAARGPPDDAARSRSTCRRS